MRIGPVIRGVVVVATAGMLAVQAQIPALSAPGGDAGPRGIGGPERLPGATLRRHVWTGQSDQNGASFGWSVARAGDVNGDGYDDVIVGAPFYDNGQTDEGQAFLYLGSATGPSTTANWTAESNQPFAYFGWAVEGVGDVNGDGYDDVIVGDYAYDNGQTDEGRAFLYLGSATGPSTTPDWIAESNQANAYFGFSVAGAGDVNADGYDDVVVGAYDYNNGQADEGRTFLYLGSATGPSSTADWTAESNQAGAVFGLAVAGAGDVDGDGYDDIIAGAPFYDHGQTDEGRTFLYLGSATGPSTTADWTAESEQDSAWFGYSVAAAGDVNTDGYDDVVVGAYTYDNGQTDEGRAFLYLGSTAGPSTSSDWTAESHQDLAYFGYSVAGAGDFNTDGYDDVIVGAYAFDNGQDAEGWIFVYLGSATGLSSTADRTAEPNQALAFFGHSVAGAGDVNADGHDDLLVGAPGYDHGQTDEGAAMVILGRA